MDDRHRHGDVRHPRRRRPHRPRGGHRRPVSTRASRELFASDPSGLTTLGPGTHYGLGILVANGWRLQNPMMNGYTGILAYLP